MNHPQNTIFWHSFFYMFNISNVVNGEPTIWFLLMWISHGLNTSQNAYGFLLPICRSLRTKKMNKTWTFIDQGLNVFERLNVNGLVFEYVFGGLITCIGMCKYTLQICTRGQVWRTCYLLNIYRKHVTEYVSDKPTTRNVGGLNMHQSLDTSNLAPKFGKMGELSLLTTAKHIIYPKCWSYSCTCQQICVVGHSSMHIITVVLL